jgi:hypothetical protein
MSWPLVPPCPGLPCPYRCRRRYGRVGSSAAHVLEPLARSLHTSRRALQKVDANVVAIKFGSLAKKADDLAAGDPEYCKRCHAVLNSLSKLYDSKSFEASKAQLVAAQQQLQAGKQKEENKKEAVAPPPAAAAAASASAAPAPAPAPAPAAAAQAQAQPHQTPVAANSAQPKSTPSASAVSDLDLSKLSLEDGDRLWICEFCEHTNVISQLQDGEIPTKASVDYVLEPAPAAAAAADGKDKDAKAGGGSGVDESVVVFCIDVSGSMCVTTEVRGKFELKGKAKAAAQEDLSFLSQFGNDYQRPQASTTSTWVSRLNAVQSAVDKQLTALHKQFPTRRVALVAFGDDVTVIGDGLGQPTVVTGDKLRDQKQLQTLGKSFTAG